MRTLKAKLPPLGTLGPLIALVLACTFFAFQHERFLTLQNFSLILQQVMVVGTIAIGQTLIILTAGIDLSCGMVMALGSIVMTKMAADYGLSAPVGILLGLLATMLFGLANGLLVTRIKLPPFIVTLGTMNIAFAITQLYSNAQTITQIPEGMNLLGETFALGGARVAWGTVLMLALYLATWLWLRETAPGRHVYAVGNNPEATRLTGIPTERVLLAHQLWQALGSRVLELSPEAHDASFAAVSHLPHLTAFALVNAVSRQPHGAQHLSMAGPGFRDFSRIAASDPNVWRDILLANRDEVLHQCTLMRESLHEFESAMKAGDADRLHALIAEASQTRSRWRLGGADSDV